MAVELTKRGIPNVLVTKKNFESLVAATSKSKHVEVNMLVLPAMINSLSDEEFDGIIMERWDEIEGGLCGREYK